MIIPPTLEDVALQKLMAAIAHDEQISVWTEEMLTDPRVGQFMMPPEEYGDGVRCAELFKELVRNLTECVIVRVLDVQHGER